MLWYVIVTGISITYFKLDLEAFMSVASKPFFLSNNELVLK